MSFNAPAVGSSKRALSDDQRRKQEAALKEAHKRVEDIHRIAGIGRELDHPDPEHLLVFGRDLLTLYEADFEGGDGCSVLSRPVPDNAVMDQDHADIVLEAWTLFQFCDCL